ncbi:hypothetical protein DL96DRAFT_1614396 [Flagelloscypha sp. PMI_526]|nr:hypothetical protein DL96DRAFT_1614396 [Flagelloscypha sp. PMI_526]
MPIQLHRSLPPNAGLPAEIWSQIIGMLPTHDRVRLRHLSACFWEAGLNAMYKSLVICVGRWFRRSELLRMQKRVKFHLKHPFISERVQSVEVNTEFTRIWAQHGRPSLFRFRYKRSTRKPIAKLNTLVERLIPNLANVRGIKFRTLIDDGTPHLAGSYFQTLLLHNSRQLVKLELNFLEDQPSKSSLLAERIDALGVTFPKLRHFAIFYHQETPHIWMQVIRRILVDSLELQTLDIGSFSILSNLEAIIPPSSAVYFRHLSGVKFSGYQVGDLELIKSYGPQLRTLGLDCRDLPLALILSTPFPLLQRLEVSCFIEEDYEQLMGILPQLSSLKEFSLSRSRGPFLTDTLHFKAMVPSLESLFISDQQFSLDYLYCLASSFPHLKFLTLQAFGSLSCNSTLLCSADIQDTPIREPQMSAVRSFASSLRTAKRPLISWKLKSLYIYLGFYYRLPENVVKELPRLVPSLPSKSEWFYTNWHDGVSE